MKIVCTSDTHTHHRMFQLPDGDILIHAGDLTNTGRIEQAQAALQWLHEQPHKYKCLIAGNHDWCFARDNSLMRDTCSQLGLNYLEDSGIEFDGLKLYGSPYTAEFCGWAFMKERGNALRMHWELIPEKVDILITHGPPARILDKTHDGENAGCEDLREIVEQRKPRVHVFGHIHESAGAITIGETRFVNTARRITTIQIGKDDIMVQQCE